MIDKSHCDNAACPSMTRQALEERIAAGASAPPLDLFSLSMMVAPEGTTTAIQQITTTTAVQQITLVPVVLCATCLASLNPQKIGGVREVSELQVPE